VSWIKLRADELVRAGLDWRSLTALLHTVVAGASVAVPAVFDEADESGEPAA
jgi:hypothetical protein